MTKHDKIVIIDFKMRWYTERRVFERNREGGYSEKNPDSGAGVFASNTLVRS